MLLRLAYIEENFILKKLFLEGAIISHKADGGLFHYLTSQGFATNIEAGCWESDVTQNHFTSVFCISIDMTEKGFKRQDNILQAVFGYIEMLTMNKPQKSFFQELQKQQLELFHYNAADNSLNAADGISRWMQFIPPKWCLISPTLIAEFDENLIQKYTESLTIDTVNVIIFSKNYRGVEYTSRSMEEFYKTAFEAFNFPKELKDKINRTKEEYARNYTLPPPNPLLLNTSCSRARETDLLTKGPLLKIKSKIAVSYVSRNVSHVRGLLPQARYSIWIGSPSSSYMGAPEGSSTKMLIWSQFLNELFESKFYHASMADIQIEAEVVQGELHLIFEGPSTMLSQLLEQVLNLFNDFENAVDPVGFEVIRSSFIECLDNTILDNRYLAWDLFYFLWTNNHDLIFDHKRNAERMTFSNFISFVKTFKTRMYIQAHLYGYVTKAQGKQIVNALTKLEYLPIETQHYLLFRCVKLPLGERVIKVHSQNPNVHTSVVINSYQFGMLTDAEEETVNFFAKTMSDAAFYQLRTEQQLGYIIIIYAEIAFGVSSIVVELVTQPKNFSTDYCNECIDQFLLSFFVENFSSPECFMEFSMGKPKLDLPFQTIKNLFAAHLLPNPVSYRKLSIQVVGDIQDAPNPPTKSADKAVLTQSVYRKVSQPQQIVADHANVADVQGDSTRISIEHIRAVKRSLQLQPQVRQSKKNGSSSSATALPTKVVKNVAKFKENLAFYPNIQS